MNATMNTNRSSHTNRISRADLLNAGLAQRNAQIFDNARFGDDVEMMVLCLHGDDVESNALFPSYADLENLGYDVQTIAAALETGAMQATELGDLIAGHKVSYVNNAVLTEVLRHYDGCEFNMDVVRAAGCDEEAIATALYLGVVSKPELMSMLRNLQSADVDTAVQCILDRAKQQSAWN